MRSRWAGAFVAGVIGVLALGMQAQGGSGGEPLTEARFGRQAKEAATAAPSPMEPTNQLTLPQVVEVLRVAGWPEDEIPAAVDVAGCESSWIPDAVGDSGEVGLFQVHPINMHRFDLSGFQRDPEDPVHNASVALQIWEEYGWEPWTCQPGAESDQGGSTR